MSKAPPKSVIRKWTMIWEARTAAGRIGVAR